MHKHWVLWKCFFLFSFENDANKLLPPYFLSSFFSCSPPTNPRWWHSRSQWSDVKCGRLSQQVQLVPPAAAVAIFGWGLGAPGGSSGRQHVPYLPQDVLNQAQHAAPHADAQALQSPISVWCLWQAFQLARQLENTLADHSQHARGGLQVPQVSLPSSFWYEQQVVSWLNARQWCGRVSSSRMWNVSLVALWRDCGLWAVAS